MAKKRSNKAPNKTATTATTTAPHEHSWPNLPKQLRNSIAKQTNLLHNITSFGCVIKSWRSSSPSLHCSLSSGLLPRLVEIQKTLEKQHIPHKIDIPFHEEHPFPYRRRSYTYNNDCCGPGKHFKAFSQGHVMLMGDGDKEPTLHLWKPNAMSLSLPTWDCKIPFKNGSVSSFFEYPSFNAKVMVITGIDSPAFAFYSPGEDSGFSWILRDCKVKDPFAPKENMRFTNCLGFRGKLYALSLQGTIAEIEYVGSCFEITRVGVNRAVPEKISRQFREYLMESDGEIFLVFLVSRRSIEFVDDVEVFRLERDELSWAKVDGVGDVALFLEDECCMSVEARGTAFTTRTGERVVDL